MKTYKAKGIVWGKYWGSGEGGYASEPLEANTKQGLLKQANKMLKDGSLDSGMGYESLIGAVLKVETIETITQNNKEYVNTEYDFVIIGDMNSDTEDLLIENL